MASDRIRWVHEMRLRVLGLEAKPCYPISNSHSNPNPNPSIPHSHQRSNRSEESMEIACSSTASPVLLHRRRRPAPSLASPFAARPLVRSSAAESRRGRLQCRCLFGLGVPELAVIAGVAALVFGPKQLPEIGRNIGKTVKGFQQAAKEFETELKKTPPGEGGGEGEAKDEGGQPKKQLETKETTL